MHHRWPIIVPLVFLAVAVTSSEQRHRELQRLVGGHIRFVDRHSDDDSELITASAGAGKDKKTGSKSDEEERKTLSQQVAEGKYGLIQKELFKKPPKRPGILSYEPNPEVPRDNFNTLGGLSKNEIWLAENHLLVIKGGTYPPHDDVKDYSAGSIWQPIDDYSAPLHQVKIPKNPKVPPPFPVQLTEDGPLQIIGTNFTRTLNGSEEATAYALPPPFDWQQNEGSFVTPIEGSADSDQTDPVTRKAPVRVSGKNPGERDGGLPFPPSLLNGTWPPSFESLPPGTIVVAPPPVNGTEPPLDEDDPSIYYPPPYSFYYPSDGNASAVPPGPLVPGIILPPPPNFFAPLEDFVNVTSTKSPEHKKLSAHTKVNLSTVPSKFKDNQAIKTPSSKPYQGTKLFKSTRPTTERVNPVNTVESNETPSRRVTSKPVKKKPTVTILRPVKTSVSTPKIYVETNTDGGRPLKTTDPQSTSKSIITTTQIPLKYYTTSSVIETNAIPEKFLFGVNNYQPQTTSKPAQYFFYEEPGINVVSISRPQYNTQNTYNKRPNNFYLPVRPSSTTTTVRPQSQILYATKPYSTDRPRYRLVPQPHRTNSFSIHVAQLQKQIHQYNGGGAPRARVRPSPKPLYQFSFQANNYQRPTNNFKPSPALTSNENNFMPLPKYSVEIQQAIEIVSPTPPPQAHRQYYGTSRPDYPKPPKEENSYVTPSVPVAEFSFEVTTPNPVHQGYYTKPDEGFFDENTKQSFTVFGRKLPSTTPIPTKSSFSRKPAALDNDIHVNYVANKRLPNPLAEFNRIPHRPEDSNIVKAIEISPVENQRDGSYISYQLPGDDGAHFYFLTPQLAQQRNQGSEYFFAHNNNRVRRKHLSI